MHNIYIHNVIYIVLLFSKRDNVDTPSISENKFIIN